MDANRSYRTRIRKREIIIQAQRDAEARLIRARTEAEANDIIACSLTPDLPSLRAIEATQAITTSDGIRTVVLGGKSEQTTSKHSLITFARMLFVLVNIP